MRVPGMLHGKVLRSPYPHARIVSIDTSAAEAREGVVAVLTGADTLDIDPFWGHAIKDRPIVAIDVVRFAGEPVAPDDFDFTVPNQPGIEVADGLTVFFNVQEYATVGGYEVLTTTAMRVVGGDEVSRDFGVVSCALPAPTVLASTGASAGDAAPLAAGAALAALLGAVLVLRRRRAA